MTRDEAIEYLNKLYMKADITDAYGDMDDTEPYEEAIRIATVDMRMMPKLLTQLSGKWHKFEQMQNPETGLWEWVNKMPDEGQPILVTITLEGHESVQKDYMYEDGMGYWLDSGYQIGDEAIAWTEMPEPYQEVE